MSNRYRWLASMIAVALLAGPAWALVPGEDIPTPSSGAWGGLDPSWVGSFNSASTAAIGEYYLLTVRHHSASVGDTISVDGGDYTVTAIYTPPPDGLETRPPDLRLVQVDNKLPGWYKLYQGSRYTLSNEPVMMVGTGVSGTDHGTYYTYDTTPDPGDDNHVRKLRWGTNEIIGTDRVTNSSYSTAAYSMEFTSGDTDYEVGLGLYDSGCGVFVEEMTSPGNKEWTLLALGGYIDDENQTDYNWVVDLAFYRNWIEDNSFTPGDSDKDGDVDATDLATVGQNWSPLASGKTWLEGDFDNDGDVDASDLARVGLNWDPLGGSFAEALDEAGMTEYYSSDPATVPEPTGLILMGLGGLAILRRRGR